MSNSDMVASSNLLSALYSSYARGLKARVTDGKMTARTRDAKLEKVRRNIMVIIDEIKTM